MTSIIANTRIFTSSRLGVLTFLLLLFSTGLGTQSCSSLSVPFSAESLNAAKNIKMAAVKLIGNATNDYSAHAADISALTTQVNDQIKTEEARGANNKQTVEMYKLMMNPEKNLLGGFLNRWKAEGQLSSFFVDEAKKQISSNFDKIINLENNKKK
ncbi:MAG: hypothetical protein AAGG75_05715 [Bacteroidota bacterium]